MKKVLICLLFGFFLFANTGFANTCEHPKFLKKNVIYKFTNYIGPFFGKVLEIEGCWIRVHWMGSGMILKGKGGINWFNLSQLYEIQEERDSRSTPLQSPLQ